VRPDRTKLGEIRQSHGIAFGHFRDGGENRLGPAALAGRMHELYHWVEKKNMVAICAQKFWPTNPNHPLRSRKENSNAQKGLERASQYRANVEGQYSTGQSEN
jgi:hypothetical protein